MHVAPLVLTAGDRRLIIVHRRVVDRISARTEVGHATREAGGIFLGSYRGDHMEVFGCTEPMATDIRTRTMFERKDPGHQAIATNAWNNSEGKDTHIGEWHTHPEAFPKPSWLDRLTWKAQMRRMQLPLLFAIGGWREIYWCLGEQGRVTLLDEVH